MSSSTAVDCADGRKFEEMESARIARRENEVCTSSSPRNLHGDRDGEVSLFECQSTKPSPPIFVQVVKAPHSNVS